MLSFRITTAQLDLLDKRMKLHMDIQERLDTKEVVQIDDVACHTKVVEVADEVISEQDSKHKDSRSINTDCKKAGLNCA